jgi:hypothetical protein
MNTQYIASLTIGSAAYKDALHTAYMNGWDRALVYGTPKNPYTREDFWKAYNAGYRACTEGANLPAWYEQWMDAHR